MIKFWLTVERGGEPVMLKPKPLVLTREIRERDADFYERLDSGWSGISVRV